MSVIFVTATGTDAGKTFISAGLLRHWRTHHLKARGFKPVVSGFDPDAPAGSDPALLIEAMGEEVTRARLDAMSPFQFRAPLAPSMAARLEGRRLELADLIAACQAQQAQEGLLLIEGAGGIMSPIAEGATCLDLVAALKADVLLVAGSYLGSISHTLTALEALRTKGIRVAAIAMNETEGSSVALGDAQRETAAFCQPIPVIALRRDETDFGALAHSCGF